MKTKCYLQGSFKRGSSFVEIGTLKAGEFPIGKDLGLMLVFPGGQSGVKIKAGDKLIVTWEKPEGSEDYGVYTVKIRTEE